MSLRGGQHASTLIKLLAGNSIPCAELVLYGYMQFWSLVGTFPFAQTLRALVAERYSGHTDDAKWTSRASWVPQSQVQPERWARPDQRPQRATTTHVLEPTPAAHQEKQSQVQDHAKRASPRPIGRPQANTRISGTHFDGPVRRVQVTPSDMNAPTLPNVNPLPPGGDALSALSTPPAGGQSISSPGRTLWRDHE